MQRRSVSDVKLMSDVVMVEEHGHAGRRKSTGGNAADVRQWKAGDERQYLPLTKPAVHRLTAVASVLFDCERRQFVRERRTVIGRNNQPTDRRCATHIGIIYLASHMIVKHSYRITSLCTIWLDMISFELNLTMSWSSWTASINITTHHSKF